MPIAGVQTGKIDERIGRAVRTVREAAGLSQKALAEKIGVSQQKIHALETGHTRVVLGELVEIAAILGVTPWRLLASAVEPPDLRSYLMIFAGQLAEESEEAVDSMMAAVHWLNRYHRMKLKMDYQPILYLSEVRAPIEFVECWENPMLDNDYRFLYVAKEKGGFRGYFFPQEIEPCASPEDTDEVKVPDFPGPTRWYDEQELRRFQQGNGYCWQMYPYLSHFEKYCSVAHRAELTAQARPTGEKVVPEAKRTVSPEDVKGLFTSLDTQPEDG